VSFILEALRKSENERQRQTGPDFASIPEAVDSRRGSRWPAVVALLVLLNAVLLAVVLWPSSEEATPAAPPPAAEPGKDAAPVAQQPSAPAARRQSASGPPGTPDDQPSAAPARSSDTAGPGAPKSQRELGIVQQDAEPTRDIRPLSGEARPTARPDESAAPAIAPATQQAAPTPEPRQRPPVAGAGRAPEPTDTGGESSSQALDGLPTANELRLQGFLTGPPLHLDLHVYYPEPSRRVVFISGNRYREGERVNGGPVVREIAPEGVVLEERGRRYLLGPD
jgi:general secretion pathway protein B